MKSISDEFLSSLQDSTINLIRCWKISLTNGNILGFTTNNENIVYDNLEYISNSSDNIINVESNIDVEEDALKIKNIISSDLISANDILSGKYNNAEIEVFLLNNFDLEQGKIIVLKGKICDIEYKDNIFIAKIVGLKNELNKEIGEVYSPLCRASFCDSKCKLNKNNFIFHGVVSEVESNNRFLTQTNEIVNKLSGYFENGTVEFTSGKNDGQKIEVKQFKSGDFILSIDLPYNIEVGDEFIAVTGCDKTFDSCCKKFANTVNFRGEPHLPGIDILLKVM